jgi:glycerate 2-kinase
VYRNVVTLNARMETLLRQSFAAAVAAAHPGRALRAHLPPPPRGRLVVVGGGKAAAVMAAAVDAHYPHEVAVTGLVVAPHGSVAHAGRIEVAFGAHPVPDAAGAAATERMLDALAELGPHDHVLVLISGGGSALLGAPCGISLRAYRSLVTALLRSGADIREMNTVRRRLGAAAGGRLAMASRGAPVTGLLVSDVVGDDPADIASGPVVPDPGGDEAALAVLARWGIDIPEVTERLRAGALHPAPPGDDRSWERVSWRVVVGNRAALAAALRCVRSAGWPARMLASDVAGDARASGALHAAIATAVAAGEGVLDPPVALLSGGETTVSLPPAGASPSARGGRNSTFALALALALPPGAPVWALAADSDGIDGVGGHAGALVTPALWERVSRAQGEAALAAFDSAGLFERAGLALVTGPTGTNVNDIRLLLVGRPLEALT